jgi:hypothetical protein
VYRKLKVLLFNKLFAEPGGCGKYEARLEDYLHGADDPELSDHLLRCGACLTALEKSRTGAQLLRDAWEPVRETSVATSLDSDSGFLAGVMAKIRDEEIRAKSPAAFWNPLEFLASRLSLTAAMVLFVLSAYMVGFAPRHAPTRPLSAQTELNAADFPQPPGDPDSNEEVLQSLVERSYGR